MIKSFIYYLTLLLVVAFLPGCTAFMAMKLVNSGEAQLNNPAESVVPFALKGHPMLVKAKLNNSPQEYSFIFDTGAMTMIRQEMAKELGLAKGLKVDAVGSGGNSKTIELTQLDRLIVGDMQVREITTGVTDFSEFFPSHIAGILGSNFLKHFKVTIDYQASQITLSKDTQPVTPADKGIRIPFKLDIQHGFAPKIKCVVNGEIECEGIIDTGALGIADLPLSMMKKTSAYKQGLALTAKGSINSGMFGMQDESLALRVNKITIGELELNNVPSISHTARTGHVNFGNKFLEKFLVTLNYPAEEMILKPYGLPFETNAPSYGIGLIKNGKKTLVSGVWENSTAAQFGMQPGDEIVRINSKDASLLSFFELAEIGLSDDIHTIEVEFISDRGRQKATLNKEMLFPVLSK